MAESGQGLPGGTGQTEPWGTDKDGGGGGGVGGLRLREVSS